MYVPAGVVDAFVVTVKVESAAGVTGFGVKFAVAPVGNPDETLRVTGELYPFTLPRETEYVVDWPRKILRDAGLADMVKSGTTATVNA